MITLVIEVFVPWAFSRLGVLLINRPVGSISTQQKLLPQPFGLADEEYIGMLSASSGPALHAARPRRTPLPGVTCNLHA
jgi:hypothetical protein